MYFEPPVLLKRGVFGALFIPHRNIFWHGARMCKGRDKLIAD